MGHAARGRRYYFELRNRVIEMLGARCVRCGFTDRRALQIDHPDGGGTAEYRELGNGRVYRNVLCDPSRYQLLCANCNWIKRAEEGENHARWGRSAYCVGASLIP